MDEKFDEIVSKYKEITEKECYVVDLVDETPSILEDKMGGIPYIPVGEEYPTDKNGNPLALLIQVNLKNIKLEGYPESGILEIFTDKDVDYPCTYAVKYYKEGMEYRTDLPEVDISEYIINKSYKIKLTKDKCYMPVADYRYNDLICDIVNEICGTDIEYCGDIDNLFDDFEFSEEFFDKVRFEKVTIGGYANFTQSDPREYELEDKDECLLKIDSYADYDKYSIGDSGMLFALISKEDIENKNFENAFVDWDCY